jgi:hypothetical protein
VESRFILIIPASESLVRAFFHGFRIRAHEKEVHPSQKPRWDGRAFHKMEELEVAEREITYKPK